MRNEYPEGVFASPPMDIYSTFAWLVTNATTGAEGEAYWIDANDGRVLLKDRIVYHSLRCGEGPC